MQPRPEPSEPLEREVDVMRRAVSLIQERFPSLWSLSVAEQATLAGERVDAVIQITSPDGVDAIQGSGAARELWTSRGSPIALPFYYKKFRPAEFNVIKHVLLPALGAVAIVIPLYYLAEPGQPAPYRWFPYAAVIIVVASFLYAVYLTRRDPSLGDRVGSIVADAE
jgi:hypothetical protein